jgi:BT1 family
LFILPHLYRPPKHTLLLILRYTYNKNKSNTKIQHSFIIMTIITTHTEEDAIFELQVGGASCSADAADAVVAPEADAARRADDADAAAAAAAAAGAAAAAADGGDPAAASSGGSNSSSSGGGDASSNAVVANVAGGGGGAGVAKDVGDSAGAAAVDPKVLVVAAEGAAEDDNIDDIAANKQEKNPWSKDFCGIPINYFSVGVIYGGSVSVLYPLLIVQHGVTSSFYAASSSLVTLFWSYKIFFGLLCDCVPILRQKWKPYIIVGWLLCAVMLVVLAGMGPSVSPTNLVVMLTFANLGYVMADVAADGFMVWMAHHESLPRRGKIQSLIYIMRAFGQYKSVCWLVLNTHKNAGAHTNLPHFLVLVVSKCTYIYI